MTVHLMLDDAARDQAALHAVGGLPPSDARSYEEHLALCAVCKAEVDSLTPVVLGLSLASPAVPPPALRARLLDLIHADAQCTDADCTHAHCAQSPGAQVSIAAAPAASAEAQSIQPWKSWDADRVPGGFAFVPVDGGSWESTSIAGIETRRLFADPAGDRVTMLVRMAPGTSYPAHVHGGPEDCYVLEGDLRVGDLHMRKGDFQRADTGSTHVVQSTDGGCVLLLVSSRRDRLLPAR